jgi:hypothetical protein
MEGRFIREAHRPTTTKVRYMSGGQQIMRLDIERQKLPADPWRDGPISVFSSPTPKAWFVPNHCDFLRKDPPGPVAHCGIRARRRKVLLRL